MCEWSGGDGSFVLVFVLMRCPLFASAIVVSKSASCFSSMSMRSIEFNAVVYNINHCTNDEPGTFVRFSVKWLL